MPHRVQVATPEPQLQKMLSYTWSRNRTFLVFSACDPNLATNAAKHTYANQHNTSSSVMQTAPRGAVATGVGGSKRSKGWGWGGCYGWLLWAVAMGGCYGWLLWVVVMEAREARAGRA